MVDLNCWNAHCTGELATVTTNGAILQCPDCGDELSQQTVEEMAEWDSPMGELARVVLSEVEA